MNPTTAIPITFMGDLFNFTTMDNAFILGICIFVLFYMAYKPLCRTRTWILEHPTFSTFGCRHIIALTVLVFLFSGLIGAAILAGYIAREILTPIFWHVSRLAL